MFSPLDCSTSGSPITQRVWSISTVLGLCESVDVRLSQKNQLSTFARASIQRWGVTSAHFIQDAFYPSLEPVPDIEVVFLLRWLVAGYFQLSSYPHCCDLAVTNRWILSGPRSKHFALPVSAFLPSLSIVVM